MKYELLNIPTDSPYYQYGFRAMILKDNAPLFACYSVELGKLMISFLNQPVISEIFESMKTVETEIKTNWEWSTTIDKELDYSFMIPEKWREQMIKVAALSVAAIQSYDRRKDAERNSGDGLPSSNDQ